jgi:hypothetical protein
MTSVGLILFQGVGFKGGGAARGAPRYRDARGAGGRGTGIGQRGHRLDHKWARGGRGGRGR